MRGLGTNHVISGQIRDLKKTASDGKTKHNIQSDIATLRLNRASGTIQ